MHSGGEARIPEQRFHIVKEEGVVDDRQMMTTTMKLVT